MVNKIAKAMKRWPTTCDFPPYRPPSEASSLLLRVTRGCPWNRCTFCSMYKNIAFEIRDPDEIEADIQTAKKLHGNEVSSVFIGDSNSLCVKTGLLVRILRSLYDAFPQIERVTSYARAQTLARKSPADLEAIRKAGLTRLHVGLETGDSVLLKQIDKGATAEEMIEAGTKAKLAGFEYSLYVLLGIGGEAGWEAHARGTAQVVNRIDPHFIRVRTVVPQPGSLLYSAMGQGRFRPSSPETILQETRRLLEELRVTSWFLSDHVSNIVPLQGKLPNDKPAMIAMLDEAYSALQKDERVRETMERKRHLTNL